MPNFLGSAKTDVCCAPSSNYRDKSFYVDDAADLLPLISMDRLEKQIHVRLEKVVEGARSSEVSSDDLLQRIHELRQIVHLHGTLTAAKE